MPVDPVSRARARMMLYRINNDWYGLLEDINSNDAKRAVKAAKELRDGLIMIAPAFVKSAYFMSDDAALIDCSLAALLWRLPQYGIEMPPKAKPVAEYAKRLFDRDSFNTSLSESERELAI
jgi:RNA polymerase-associated protein